jgi:hypothetical protein
VLVVAAARVNLELQMVTSLGLSITLYGAPTSAKLHGMQHLSLQTARDAQQADSVVRSKVAAVLAMRSYRCVFVNVRDQ